MTAVTSAATAVTSAAATDNTLINSEVMTASMLSETAFANLMLYGILNAACEGGSVNPPSEQDVNQALAAVTGIGARDEDRGHARDADGGNACRVDDCASPG